MQLFNALFFCFLKTPLKICVFYYKKVTLLLHKNHTFVYKKCDFYHVKM